MNPKRNKNELNEFDFQPFQNIRHKKWSDICMFDISTTFDNQMNIIKGHVCHEAGFKSNSN